MGTEQEGVLVRIDLLQAARKARSRAALLMNIASPLGGVGVGQSVILWISYTPTRATAAMCMLVGAMILALAALAFRTQAAKLSRDMVVKS